MENRPGLRALSIGAVLCAGLLSFATPADDEGPRLGRARNELQILFENRVELQLLEARNSADHPELAHTAEVMEENPEEEAPEEEAPEVEVPSVLSDEAVAGFMEKSGTAIEAFFAKHAPKIQTSQNPQFGDESPITYEPFATFMASEAWLSIFTSELPESVQIAWGDNAVQRTERLEDSLGAMLEERVAYAMCLHPEERGEVRASIQRAAKKQLEEGAIGLVQNYWYGNSNPDAFRDLMKAAKLGDYLSDERAKLFREMASSGRTAFHDYRFEIEYWLHGREDAATLRPLLYGGAEALIHRSGRHPGSVDLVFETQKGSTTSSDWARILRGALDLPDDEKFDDIPLRSREEYSSARATFFLNVLDQRLIFSVDQRASLLPLLKEFVDKEVQRSSRYRPVKPELPGSFGLTKDGLYNTGANRNNQLSTDMKSKLTAFRDACTQKQLDVLDV